MPSLYGNTTTFIVSSTLSNSLYAYATTGSVITGTVQNSVMTSLYQGGFLPQPTNAELILNYLDNNGDVQFFLDPAYGNNKIYAITTGSQTTASVTALAREAISAGQGIAYSKITGIISATNVNLFGDYVVNGNVITNSSNTNIDFVTNNETWSFNADGSTSFPNYVFPAASGSSFQTLANDGAGHLFWNTGTIYTTSTTDLFAGNSIQTVFTLTNTPIGQTFVNVFVGGVYQTAPTSWTLQNQNEIVFSQAPPPGTFDNPLNIEANYSVSYAPPVILGVSKIIAGQGISTNTSTGVVTITASQNLDQVLTLGNQSTSSINLLTAVNSMNSTGIALNDTGLYAVNPQVIPGFGVSSTIDFGILNPGAGTTTLLQMFKGRANLGEPTYFAPSQTGMDLGTTSTYGSGFNNLYLNNNFVWNSATIVPPTGSTNTFLRNDGTWAVPPGGGGTGTSGVSSITAGSGISINTSTGNVTISATNTTTPFTGTYVSNIVAGQGISINTSSGVVTITATNTTTPFTGTYVSNILAGSGISINTSTGAVTISAINQGGGTNTGTSGNYLISSIVNSNTNVTLGNLNVQIGLTERQYSTSTGYTYLTWAPKFSVNTGTLTVGMADGDNIGTEGSGTNDTVVLSVTPQFVAWNGGNLTTGPWVGATLCNDQPPDNQLHDANYVYIIDHAGLNFWRVEMLTQMPSIGALGSSQFAISIQQLVANGQSVIPGNSSTQYINITNNGNNIALGNSAGQTGQSAGAVAIGGHAGQTNQSNQGIAIGVNAGQTNQSNQAIAIGYNAGSNNQGTNAIAIGAWASYSSQAANSIIINASGAITTATTTSSFYVNPIRHISTSTLPSGFYNMAYNPTTGEIIYWS